MMTYNIHAHATRKTGWKPYDKARPVMRLADILTGVIPDHPPSASYLDQLTDRSGYDNNVYGTCGPVSLAEYMKLVTKMIGAQEMSVTTSDVDDLYKRSGNPNFPNQDDGVDMSVMLSAAVKGGLRGKRVLAFALCDTSNQEEIKAAEAIFGGGLFGSELQYAQLDQSDAGQAWDYVPGSPIAGGHAYLGAWFSGSLYKVGTWGLEQPVTVPFVTMFIQGNGGEFWIVILDEHFGSKQFIQGIDQVKLAAAYKSLTGRDFPTPVPGPAPTPDPTPAPTPEPSPPVPTGKKIRITGVASARWLVTVDDVVQAKTHNSDLEAAEHAQNALVDNPESDVRIIHDAEYTVTWASAAAEDDVGAFAEAEAGSQEET